MPDERIDKWRKWIEGSIRSDVLTMHLQRDAYRTVAKIITDNGQLPESYWWEFMRDTYAVTQAVAVRRQADRHRDVTSLGKLIEEIRDDSMRITRADWIALWDDDDTGYAGREWAKHYAGNVGTSLDAVVPAADFESLTKVASKVKTYVDRAVAHLQDAVDPAEVAVTLTEVHEAVDVIGHLFQKYTHLLTAVDHDLVPIIQHDWTAIFREPWQRP